MSNVTQMTAVPADLIGAPVHPVPLAAKEPSKPKPVKAEEEEEDEKPPEDEPEDPPKRLVISESKETGDFVYSILDRNTGQVLVQIPREEVARIAARPDYTAGQVVDTKV